MRREDIDWGILRGGLVFLAVAVVLGGSALGSGYWFWNEMNTAYERQRAALDRVRGRYQSLDQEEEIIETYLPRYRALEAAGIIGREHRLDWIEALKGAAERARLPALSYVIDSQIRWEPEFVEDSGIFDTYASEMKLNLGLLHEGDLRALLRELRREAKGLFGLAGCDLRRARTTLSRDPKHANLRADCALRWITIRPPEEGSSA